MAGEFSHHKLPAYRQIGLLFGPQEEIAAILAVNLSHHIRLEMKVLNLISISLLILGKLDAQLLLLSWSLKSSTRK